MGGGTITSRGGSAALETDPAPSASLAPDEAVDSPNDAAAPREASCNSMSEPITVVSPPALHASALTGAKQRRKAKAMVCSCFQLFKKLPFFHYTMI